MALVKIKVCTVGNDKELGYANVFNNTVNNYFISKNKKSKTSGTGE